MPDAVVPAVSCAPAAQAQLVDVAAPAPAPQALDAAAGAGEALRAQGNLFTDPASVHPPAFLRLHVEQLRAYADAPWPGVALPYLPRAGCALEDACTSAHDDEIRRVTLTRVRRSENPAHTGAAGAHAGAAPDAPEAPAAPGAPDAPVGAGLPCGVPDVVVLDGADSAELDELDQSPPRAESAAHEACRLALKRGRKERDTTAAEARAADAERTPAAERARSQTPSQAEDDARASEGPGVAAAADLRLSSWPHWSDRPAAPAVPALSPEPPSPERGSPPKVTLPSKVLPRPRARVAKPAAQRAKQAASDAAAPRQHHRAASKKRRERSPTPPPPAAPASDVVDLVSDSDDEAPAEPERKRTRAAGAALSEEAPADLFTAAPASARGADTAQHGHLVASELVDEPASRCVAAASAAAPAGEAAQSQQQGAPLAANKDADDGAPRGAQAGVQAANMHEVQAHVQAVVAGVVAGLALGSAALENGSAEESDDSAVDDAGIGYTGPYDMPAE